MKSPASLVSPATMLALLLLLAMKQKVEAYVPAMYVFGDSTADVGNNNHLSGSSKANYLPYGIDFPGGIPTGRFCNGFIGADFIAQNLGFEKSPPPALSITSASQELKGVNFASGGSGILDSTAQNISLSMKTQIKFFESSARRLARSKGRRATELFLSKSMFLLSTGSNDFFAFLEETGLQNQTLNDSFISSLITQFRDQLQRLYNLGARKFAIFGVGRIGCIALATRSFNDSGDCMQGLDDLSQAYNKGTREMLVDLKSKLLGMKYSFAKTYEISSFIGADPLQFGFKVANAACCGSVQSPCTPNTICCVDRDEYMMWDNIHPTQAAYKTINGFAYDGGEMFAVPINFRQLVNAGLTLSEVL